MREIYSHYTTNFFALNFRAEFQNIASLKQKIRLRNLTSNTRIKPL